MASINNMAKRGFRFRRCLVFVIATAILLVCLKHGRRWYELIAIRRSKSSYDRNIRRVARRQENMLRANAGPFDALSTEKLKELVGVWHNGVADNFTSYGSLIVGVPPDAKKAKLAYEELIKRGGGDSSMYSAYAKLSEFGTPNDESVVDKKRALALYQKHYESLTDLYQRYDALEAVERLSPPGVVFQVSALRSDIAGQMAALARTNRRAATAGTNPRATALAGTNRLQAGPPGLRNRFGMNLGDAWIQDLPLVAFRAQTIAGGGDDRVGDRQNVHDSTVTKTVSASVGRLRNQCDNTIDTASSMSDIRDMIRCADISDDKRATANLALESIERNDQLNHAAGITETELLKLVWNRLHHRDNHENREALRENLVDELSACVENGGTVCSTGRFTHILGTLNGVDDVVDIKPGWALSKELVERAGVLYKDRIGALADEDRAAVEAQDPSREQQTRNDEIMDTVRKDLRDDFKRAYVDAGIMTQEGLDVELNKWIDHIG